MDKDEQRREIYFLNRLPQPSALNLKKVFVRIGSEPDLLYEREPPVLFARHAKAIVKGDPREFMG